MASIGVALQRQASRGLSSLTAVPSAILISSSSSKLKGQFQPRKHSRSSLATFAPLAQHSFHRSFSDTTTAASDEALSEAASEALQKASAAWRLHSRRGSTSGLAGRKALSDACRSFLSSQAALGERERLFWWSQQASLEDEEQLDELSRALPRGGRIAPQLLESFHFAEPGSTEALVRGFLAGLHTREGLTEVLRVRSYIQSAALFVGPNSTAWFSLDRLDRRIQDLLSFYLHPSMLALEIIAENSPKEVKDAAVDVAKVAAPWLDSSTLFSQGQHLCFSLHHPQMVSSDGSCSPLLVAHASLTGSLPNTVFQALGSVQNQNPEESSVLVDKPIVGCIWSLGPAPAFAAGDSLRGLGLEHILREKVAEHLRRELKVKVSAFVPLRNFRSWLRTRQPWQGRGWPSEIEASLRRAAEGRSVMDTQAITFVDADGDKVEFRLVADTGALALSIGDDGALREVARLGFMEGAVLVLLEAGAEAVQINVPKEVEDRGDLRLLAELAEAAAIVGVHLREPILRLAYEYIHLSGGDGFHASDPAVHFHLLSGGDFSALHWRADESTTGLSESLGVMASFSYDSTEGELRRAQTYVEKGIATLRNAEE